MIEAARRASRAALLAYSIVTADEGDLEAILHAVVHVGCGSGFLVAFGDSPVIVTAGHAARSSDLYRSRAKVLGTTGIRDLAVIATTADKVAEAGRRPLVPARMSTAPLDDGTELVAVGFLDEQVDLLRARTILSRPCSVSLCDLCADLQRDGALDLFGETARECLHLDWPRAAGRPTSGAIDRIDGFPPAKGMSGGPVIARIEGLWHVVAVSVFENAPFDASDEARYLASTDNHCILAAPLVRMREIDQRF